MEKGFNDDELADIMNEIESLEKEFSKDDEGRQTENVETRLVDSQDSQLDEDLGEVLEEMSQMPIEQVAPQGKANETIEQPVKTSASENVRHLQHSQHSQHSEPKEHKRQKNAAMNFHVEGEMKLEMSFHIAGKFVGLTVTEEGLEIGLDGGAKFTIPMEEDVSRKKAS